MKQKILFTIIGLLGLGVIGVAAKSFFLSDVSLQMDAVEAMQEESSTKADTATSVFTLAQIAEHDSVESCYTAIAGSVYDLTPFVAVHPGGPAILALCGIDGTEKYMKQHGASDSHREHLATLKIGTLLKE